MMGSEGTTDVDAATLRAAMSEREQRIVRDAWRDAEPATQDGILAAVALNRVRKHRPYLGFLAVGWSAYVVASLVTLPDGGTSRTVAALVVAGLAAAIAGWAGFSFVRSRRNEAALASVADHAAAADRARDLRAAG